MTRNEARWAEQHDWFYGWDYSGGIVTAREVVREESGERVTKLHYFEDAAEMRSWAGY